MKLVWLKCSEVTSFLPFSFGHCFVCSSSIYGFWLPLWYLQTLLNFKLLKKSTVLSSWTEFDRDIFWLACQKHCTSFICFRVVVIVNWQRWSVTNIASSYVSVQIQGCDIWMKTTWEKYFIKQSKNPNLRDRMVVDAISAYHH
jgi:hypothetical protein